MAGRDAGGRDVQADRPDHAAWKTRFVLLGPGWIAKPFAFPPCRLGKAIAQPMVIRLALPPAAAVLTLRVRSTSRRSSGMSVSPLGRPMTAMMGPLRRAICWLMARSCIHQQAFQRDVGVAAGQADDGDDGAAAACDLLADGAQLLGVAVVQQGVDAEAVAGPVADQADAVLHPPRQCAA